MVKSLRPGHLVPTRYPNDLRYRRAPPSTAKVSTLVCVTWRPRKGAPATADTESWVRNRVLPTLGAAEINVSEARYLTPEEAGRLLEAAKGGRLYPLLV